MATNHSDALPNLEGDRRVFVISNGLVEWTPKQFIELYRWFDNGEWLAHVGSWLLDRDISNFNGYAPAPMTEGKRQMICDTVNEVDMVVRDTLDNMNGDYIFDSLVIENAMKQLVEGSASKKSVEQSFKRQIKGRGFINRIEGNKTTTRLQVHSRLGGRQKVAVR